MTVQQNCPNNTAGPCNWRNSDNPEVTSVKEAQDLPAIHFGVCSTNPDVIQKKQECQEEAEHRHQRDQAAEVRANLQATDMQKAVEKNPAKTATAKTTDPGYQKTPDDYNLFMAQWERYRHGCIKPHNHNA